MLSSLLLIRPQPAATLKFTDVRSYVITIALIACDVLLPRLFHAFNLAGPSFLPMHFLVLFAGLVFGWRAGLALGLFTPAVSYALSGMPVLPMLPQTVVELSAYGLAAGVLREKIGLRLLPSLLGSMAAGRIVLLVASVVVYHFAGQSQSPVGLETNPFSVVCVAVKQGLPGIAAQVIFVPALAGLTIRLLSGGTERKCPGEKIDEVM